MQDSRSNRSRSRVSAGTRTATMTGAMAAAVAAFAVAPLAEAQQGSGGGASGQGRARTVSVSGQRTRALTGACADITALPTRLMEAPEGRALVRIKKDLEEATAIMDNPRVASGQRVELERIRGVERNIDSLMRVFVQLRGENGPVHSIELRPGGERVMVNGELQRGQVEATIRALMPEIAAMKLAAGRMFTTRFAAPQGWLGVTVSQSARDVPTEEGMLTHYCEYPVVETVVAGSPAEKAGLHAGDTITAYNGRDLLSAPINPATLFVPNRTLKVRVRRDGRTRELPVTLVPNPGQTRILVSADCLPSGECRRMVRFDTLRALGSGGAISGGMPLTSGDVLMGGRSNVIIGRATPMPAVPPFEPMLQGTGLGMMFGARLSVVDEVLADRLGVEPGVLVLSAPPGSAAANARLRGGDVIRAVNGVPLADLTTLRRATLVPGVREVKLTVSAKGEEPRVVTLRW